MVRINLYSVRQFKEDGGLYDVKRTVTHPTDVVNAAKAVLGLSELAQEKFGIITLNTKNDIVGMHVLSIGSLNATIVHPREVFKAAILNNAASLICFHNHPSGDPSPSQADIEMTLRLVEAGTLMGIEVLDHVIVGDGDRYCSLKETGVM